MRQLKYRERETTKEYFNEKNELIIQCYMRTTMMMGKDWFKIL